MIAPPEVVNNTAVRFNGIEISAQQAKDMVEYGQRDMASYQRALSEALALPGYIARGLLVSSEAKNSPERPGAF